MKHPGDRVSPGALETLMKIKAKAVTSFTHGNLHAHRGADVELNKAEAEDLRKLGLIDYEDEKAEAAPKNKMDGAPQNKADTVEDDDLVGADDDQKTPRKNATKTTTKKD